jgi:hypothetical protein
MTPVIYWINLFLENTNTTTQTMPITSKRSDPVLTKTINPKSARPNAINPNLSLYMHSPVFKGALCSVDGCLIKTIPIFGPVLGRGG